MEDSIGILKELIKIRSDNPGNYEEDIALFISDILHKNKINHKIVYSANRRANIVGYLEGKKENTLILCGHLDTKPADENWTYNPFTPTVVGNKLYGLGAADMKGGIAALLSALIQNKEKCLQNTVSFIFVADEEMNSDFGIKYLAKHGYIKGNFAIVAEPTSLKLATRSLGNLWLRVIIKGKKSHAGMYWRGINAIDVSIYLLHHMKKFIKKCRYLKEKDPELMRFPNLNIGTIKGGSHPGSVADICEFTIDVRFKEKNEKIFFNKRLRELISKVAKQFKCSFSVDYFGGGGLPPWSINEFRKEDINNYLQIIEKSYAKVLNKPIRKITFLGGSDAGILTQLLKIPSVIIGPGSLEQAHSPDEWVYIDEVINASSIYSEIIRRWCYG